MQVTGYLTDGSGRRIKGTAGIIDASGKVIIAYDDTAADGSFLLNPRENEYVYVTAPGYVTKILSPAMIDGGIVLNKPVNMGALLLVAPIAYYLFNQKKKKGKGVGALNFGVNDVKTIFWIVGGLLAFDTIRNILQSLGFWKDANARVLDQASADPNSFWNPNFWKRFPAYTYAIDETTANKYARDIEKALGWWNDDESAIINVFHLLRTQANISFVAWAYQNIFGKDLFTVLRGGNWPQDGISDSDLAALNNYGTSLTAF